MGFVVTFLLVFYGFWMGVFRRALANLWGGVYGFSQKVFFFVFTLFAFIVGQNIISQTFVNIYVKTFLHETDPSIQKHSREKKNSKRLPCMASNNLIFCNEKYIRILRKRRSQTTTKKTFRQPKRSLEFPQKIIFFCCKSNLPISRQQ